MISTISFFHSSPRRKGTGLFTSYLCGLEKKKRKEKRKKKCREKNDTANLSLQILLEMKSGAVQDVTRGLGWFHSICGIP